jgi:hypothetical protein
MEDYVRDEEVLYRRVLNRPEYFTQNLKEEGEWIVTRTAFYDSSDEISVDRAALCNNNPLHTQNKDPANGVVQLTAKEVREIGGIKHGGTHVEYEFDVIPDPIKDNPELEDNLAHALIWPDPKKVSKGASKRLREALARIANKYGWLIPPKDIRNS